MRTTKTYSFHNLHANQTSQPPIEQKKKFQISGTEFIVDYRYDVLKQIGVGAYGVVVSAIDHKENKKYAIKKVLKNVT